MKKMVLSVIASVMLCLTARGQDQPVKKDTTALPRLEIPEITIVGKKAITLPFARKGEIYDVNIYEAPRADTSVLEQRPAMSLPIGSLPRYDEPLIPWHLSAEGSFGTFSTGHFRGYLDYKGRRWGIYGNGGYNSTRGHVDGAAGNSFQMEANAHSIISTDNEILKSFRVSGGFQLLHEKYGLYGIKSSGVNRSRTNVVFDTKLNSLDRESGALDFKLRADIWSLSDNSRSSDSSASSVSPEIAIAYTTKFDAVQLMSNVSYSSSSLSYDHPAQSPSLFKATAEAKWNMIDKLSMQLGAIFSNGSGSDGASRSLISPVASVKWELDQDRALSVWLQPEIRLKSYGELSKINPYLIREIAIKPERVPFNLGSTFWYNSEIFSVEVTGGFSTSSNRSITTADSGKIRFAFAGVNEFTVRANGSIKPAANTDLIFAGVIHPAYERGKSIQLPMTPLIQIAARGVLVFDFPLSLFSSIELWSRQNVDLAGKKTIGDRILIGAGASTAVIPRTVLSLDIKNLFNQKYEWWSFYEAPGIMVELAAKMNFR